MFGMCKNMATRFAKVLTDMRGKRLALSAVLVASVVGSAVAFASPASAAVSGLERLDLRSARDSTSPKVVNLECTWPKVLVGAAAEISGGSGEVGIDIVRPSGDSNSPPRSVLVTASEEDAFGGTWDVTAYANCADAIAGLVRVDGVSPGGSPDGQTGTATCPAGKVLLGTGFEIGGSLGEVVVDQVIPNGTRTVAPTSVSARAYEADPDFPSNWTVTAYAICALPQTVQGLAQVGDVTRDGISPDTVGVTKACPSGTVLLGTGFEIDGGRGEVVLDNLRPNGGVGVAPTELFAKGFEADPNHTEDWYIRSILVCANV